MARISIRTRYCFWWKLSINPAYPHRKLIYFFWFYILDESDETKAFLTLLSTWDKQELEQRLGQRVEFSKRAIGKLLQAFDRLLQRNEKLHKSIQEKVEKEAEEVLELGTLKKDGETKKELDGKKEINVDVKKEGESKPDTDEQKDAEEKKADVPEGEIKQESENTGKDT